MLRNGSLAVGYARKRIGVSDRRALIVGDELELDPQS